MGNQDRSTAFATQETLQEATHMTENLVQHLRRGLRNRAERGVFRFLVDGEREGSALNGQELDHRARTIAAHLQQASAQRALLIYPPGLEFIEAFLGCLYAGVIAIPAYPPQSRRALPRLAKISESAKQDAVLTRSSHFTRFHKLAGEIDELAEATWISTDTLAPEAAEWQEPDLGPDTIAFLQYTSGSTSDPKGVIVQHRHLIHNQEMMRKAFQQDERSVVVSWLPVYHDMGLIGAVLQPLWSGGEAILMSPVSFLQKPLRWLQAISNYRADTSGAPNFAYDLCVERIRPEQLENLDLSSWTVAFNGAEPVRADTLERFSERFKTSGFRSEAFFPCYGLAEATLYVSGGRVDSAPLTKTFSARALEAGVAQAAEGEADRSLVSCGRLIGEQMMKIVDPETRKAVDEGRIGEIWLSGQSIAGGYEGREELSQEVFGARLAKDSEAGPFLRTGDLGFAQDGELFITGRLKDLIIVRGRNHHPEDLEQTVAASHSALAPSTCAAFTSEDDQLILVQELSRGSAMESAEIAEVIRQEISAQHELRVDEVVFIRTATLPKTPSGKVQRQKCRSLLAAQELKILARHALDRDQGAEDSATSNHATALEDLDFSTLLALPEEQQRVVIEGELRGMISSLLRLDPHQLPSDRPLSRLGLDSLEAVRLQETLQRRFQLETSLEAILDGLTLENLTQALQAHIETRPTSEPSDPFANLEAHGAPQLSFEQERLWWLSQIQPDSSAFNIPVALRLHGEIDVDRLASCLTKISHRHASLRSRFVSISGQPTLALDADSLSLSRHDLVAELPQASPDERLNSARKILRDAVDAPFDLAAGPPARALWIGLDERTSVLAFIAHHLVFDLWSGRLLVQEWAALYERENIEAPPLAYSTFAAWQRQTFESGEWASSLDFWRQQLQKVVPVELPTDRPRSQKENRHKSSADAQTHTFTVPAQTAQALSALGQEQGATLFHSLSTLFQLLLAKVCQQDEITLVTPVAGRPLTETRRAIGFFAYPMVLTTDLSGCEDFGSLLQRVRKTALETYAHQQVPFSKVIEVAEDRARLRPKVLFGLLDEHGETDLPRRLGDATVELVELDQQATDFEQAWTLFRDGETGALRGQVVYQSDLFDAATLKAMVRSYIGLIDTVLAKPELPLAKLELDHDLQAQAERARQRDTPQRFVISATFTADLLADSLAFWADQLSFRSEVELAPYHQTIQQMLSPASELRQNIEGCNVILFRLEDAWRFRGEAKAPTAQPGELLERFLDDFLPALAQATEARTAPFFLCLCPPSPQAEAEHGAILSSAEARIVDAAKELPALTLITWSEVEALYPVAEYYDAYGDEIGHLPYQETFFSALGTYLIRRWQGLRRKPFKVIALDCDQTLWRGVCAEDGVDGISIESPFADLQRFMIEQQQAGKVLVLVSKNDETDVLDVFDQRNDLPLKREHLATWRINWQPKSQNLLELAEELQLGLDSFLFVDDNPVECAEVTGRLPEVLTLAIPSDTEQVMSTLKHCWALDAWGQTDEDQQRTRFYQQNAEREAHRRQTADLSTFLEALNLEVEIEPMSAAQADRVAQLTQRTNQFNCSTIRRSPAEINACGKDIRTISVSDRYGDYGLVGTVIVESSAFKNSSPALVVDTLLLSCRALGRGVEHHMLAHLGQLALERGLDEVVIPYRPTRRNRPAFQFLASVAAEISGRKFVLTEEHDFRFPAEQAAQCRYRPDASAQDVAPTSESREAPPTAPREWVHIAQNLSDLERIHKAVRAFKLHQSDSATESGAYIAPRNALEVEVANLWTDLLNQEQISVDASFFALGGDSLIAVQLLSRVREQFQVELTMRDALDEDVTIASLAQAIERAQIDQASEEDIDDILAELDGLSEEEIQLLLAEEEVG